MFQGIRYYSGSFDTPLRDAPPLIDSLSIIIPAYNEEWRLPETIRRIESYFQANMPAFLEILIVDDGSKDATVRVAESFHAANSNIRVLRNPSNRGKGYSVRHGMLEGRGEWLLFSDADLSTPIEEIEKLWAAIQRDQSQVAIGSRALDRSLIGVHQPGFRETAGKIFNAVMRVFIRLPLSDTQCGFKLFRKDVARQVFSKQKLEGFGFDVEVLYLARKAGRRISEVPVRWNHADNSRVSAMNGIRAFVELLEVRWNSLLGRYK